MASVSATSARLIVEHVRELGLDADTLLREAALSASQINDAEARLDSGAIAMLWWRAYRTTQDDALGLHVAETARKGSYAICHFITAHSPTVGAAFARICAYSRWADDSLRLRVVSDGERVGVELPAMAGSPCAQRLAAEHALALSYLGVARSSGLPLRLEDVEIAAPSPCNRAERERVFGCRVRFARPASRLWLSRETWDRPVPGADAALLSLLEAHAQTLLDRLPAAPSLLREAHDAVVRRLGSGTPTLQRIARDLGTSPRSLQRALASQQTSYSEIVDQARVAAARNLLTDRSLTIAEIALQLGFSEQSAFTRACKRWLGMPPIKLRALNGSSTAPTARAGKIQA